MLTVGHIDYMNTLPVFYYFDPAAIPGVRVVRSTPAELNRRMREGTVDIGPMSSFAYGLDADRYVLLPHLSVSAYGAVGSIFLFSHRPLHTLARPHVLLTTRSATSVQLLKILLERHLGLRPTYAWAEPDLEAMLGRGDAALLIGDEAMLAFRENRRYYVADLGELWRRYTGQWMTFAVWGVRREALAEDPEGVARVYRAFLRSKARTKADPTPLVRAAKARLGGSDAEWYRYFAGLSHELDRPQLEGLRRFFAEAAAMGALPRVPEIAFATLPPVYGRAAGEGG
ncbi:MAG: menaquinone biosynthesis protein [Hydrogenibacillus schlegelii]|nr:menaquinone biosynthesis protein [Hydrogenibacillus schlegelii]